MRKHEFCIFLTLSRLLLFLLLCTPLASQGTALSGDFARLYPQGAAPDGPADQRKGLPNNGENFNGPLPELPPLQGPPGLIRRVNLPSGQKLVALTYDLCELQRSVSGFDVPLVAFLRDSGIAATFFAGGKWMRTHVSRVQELLATPFFEIGNHAWTHGNFGTMPLDMARDQILWTQGIYSQAVQRLQERLGKTPETAPPLMTLFRPPYGRVRPETLGLLHDLGFNVIQWDVVAETEGDNSAPAVAARTAGEVRPGSIVLMHANRVPKGTAELTRRLVKLLEAAGYRFVTVSELLAAGKPELSTDGYFTHPGDNLGLDHSFGLYGTGAKP